MRINQLLKVLPVVTLVACSSNRDAQPTPVSAIPVKIGKVRQIEERKRIAASGSIASQENPSTLSFLVGGKVTRVGPREGEPVRRDQVLAEIDSTDYKLALDAAVAQSAAARAVLDKAEAPARPEVLEQARIAFERAADEYRRMQMLYDSKSLAANDLAKVRAAYDASKQQYDQAKAGGQKEDRAQARAAVDQAAAAEAIARKRLSDATLRSPLDGFIGRRSVEAGDMAAPGRPAFEVVRLDPVEVSVGVPETDVHMVRVGQKAAIHTPAVPGVSFEGTVRVISVSADPNTRTYMARIGVPNPRHVLRLGMIAEAQIESDQTLTASTLPGDAVVRDAQGATVLFVYTPEHKRVYAKRVEVGTVYGQDLEIRSGLAGDEWIVVGGQHKLRDGMLVEASPVSAALATARESGRP